MVWFGSVVAALKSLKSTAEDASNLEASGLADGCPLDDMAPLLEKLAAMHKPLMFWFKIVERLVWSGCDMS